MAAFDTDPADDAPGGWLYRGTIPSRWNIGAMPNSGYVLAVALAAVRAEAGAGPLTATAHFLSPCGAGDVEIGVEVLKQGRSLSTVTARLDQGERTRLA